MCKARLTHGLIVAIGILSGCGDAPTHRDGGLDAAPLSCASQAQCDDGVFCNGAEACAPGAPGASALGCRAGVAPCETTQICDEDEDACVSICGVRTDADGDGFDAVECGGTDCDDTDEARFPGAPERCNGRDDDCDERTDETACVDGGTDAGADGGWDAGADGGVDAGADGGADAGADAGLDASSVSAATCEACALHDDCAAGSVCVSLTIGGRACVPGCSPDVPSCPRGFNCVLDIASGVDATVCLPVGGSCCVDADADGYGTGDGCAGSDCDDGAPSVHPSAPELCNASDDDCDGSVDEGPTPCETGFCRFESRAFTRVTGGACIGGGCSGGVSTSCGLYGCEGDASGATCRTSCLSGTSDDDALCVADGRCDSGACLPRLSDGSPCDEDTDCVGAHCDNGFCCASGSCCATAADCPGGGGTSFVCDDAATCQGARSSTTCVSYRCVTLAGIADDSGCDPTVRARDCGLHDPVYCTGASSQTSSPSCPTSCIADDECIEGAHCAGGSCLPDRPPGAPCARDEACQSWLTCVDDVCCTSPCGGPCQACNLAGSAGSCAAIPGCVP